MIGPVAIPPPTLVTWRLDLVPANMAVKLEAVRHRNIHLPVVSVSAPLRRGVSLFLDVLMLPADTYGIVLWQPRYDLSSLNLHVRQMLTASVAQLRIATNSARPPRGHPSTPRTRETTATPGPTLIRIVNHPTINIQQPNSSLVLQLAVGATGNRTRLAPHAGR